MLTRTDFDNARTAQEVATLARRVSEDILVLADQGALNVIFIPADRAYQIKHPCGVALVIQTHGDNGYVARAYLADRSIDFGFAYISEDDADRIDAILERAEREVQ